MSVDISEIDVPIDIQLGRVYECEGHRFKIGRVRRGGGDYGYTWERAEGDGTTEYDAPNGMYQDENHAYESACIILTRSPAELVAEAMRESAAKTSADNPAAACFEEEIERMLKSPCVISNELYDAWATLRAKSDKPATHYVELIEWLCSKLKEEATAIASDSEDWEKD